MIRDPETLNALLDAVNRFVRERLVPAEAVVAETDEIPADIVREMKELGLFGLTDPRGIRRPGPDDGRRGAGDARAWARPRRRSARCSAPPWASARRAS